MIHVVHIDDRLPRRARRFLVERLWPKRIARKDLEPVTWCKDATPTHDLLRWYGNKLERWMEFQADFEEQLLGNPRAWEPILDAAREEDIVLVHAARDKDYCPAQALADFLRTRL